MHADLDALVTAVYVLVDDFLPGRSGPGRPPRISDAELVALAVAQVLLGLPNDRQFLALAGCRLGHLFPYLPKQPGCNKRLRKLAPEIGRAINYLVYLSPSFCDGLRLLDSTPVPCGQSRETVRRSEFAGHAGYGYCRSHSRWFWGFRLYLLCAADGTPIAFELAAANLPERQVAQAMLERVPLEGHTVIADKGFAGRGFGSRRSGLPRAPAALMSARGFYTRTRDLGPIQTYSCTRKLVGSRRTRCCAASRARRPQRCASSCRRGYRSAWRVRGRVPPPSRLPRSSS